MDILIEELDESLWVAATDKKTLQALEVDPATEEVRAGSIYLARVIRIDTTLDAAFVLLDGENIGLLNSGDLRVKRAGKITKGGTEPITKLLSSGDMVLVQAKEGQVESTPTDLEHKAPRVSMNITLPGRYLIHTPFETDSRISQRIRDKSIRKNLEAMQKDMKEHKSCILRSAAANTQTEMLVREHKILTEMWEQLDDHVKEHGTDEPQLIMLGPDAIQRTLSDLSDRQIKKIEVIVLEHFQDVEDWCELFAPDLMTKIHPLEIENPYDNLALFDHRDILGEIDSLFQPYSILKSGATIIMQETAALTAIDVNRAADTDSNFQINCKAGDEIARQIRLRNMGGIIIIDALKMKKENERKDFLKSLDKAFLNDPCTVQIHGLTKLGLVEITRARRTPTLKDRCVTEKV